MKEWSAGMNDRMERLEGALIQHGPDGNRIYLMAMPPYKDSDSESDFRLVSALSSLYREKGYTKIFAKSSARRVVPFLLEGYSIEAYVPRLYRGLEDVYFLGYYGDPQSSAGNKRRRIDPEAYRLFDSLLRKKRSEHAPPLAGRYRWFHCTEGDIEEMAGLYASVFDRYPFPIHEAAYLRKTMKDNVEYFGIRDRQSHELVGLSSAEYHRSSESMEMTDFAVLPETRGDGLGLFLLGRMEEYAAEKGIAVAYTIARLRSPGMNSTFLKGGYHYAGTLPNNTYIGGGLESMNVFYKVLLPVKQ
jgi:putative beta-lysine N-acetyltransferase